MDLVGVFVSLHRALVSRPSGVCVARVRCMLHTDGFMLLMCPDLQAAAEKIAQDKLLNEACVGIRP